MFETNKRNDKQKNYILDTGNLSLLIRVICNRQESIVSLTRCPIEMVQHFEWYQNEMENLFKLTASLPNKWWTN